VALSLYEAGAMATEVPTAIEAPTAARERQRWVQRPWAPQRRGHTIAAAAVTTPTATGFAREDMATDCRDAPLCGKL